MAKKTILADVNGWSPVIDAIVYECGLIPAAVFGAVWRYCQMSSGECTASQERIAQRCGISRRRVICHLETLVRSGYLSKIVKDGIGVTYRDTGKAGLTIGIQAHPIGYDISSQVDSFTCDISSQGVCQNVTPTCDESSHKETLLRDSLRDVEREDTPGDEFSIMVERVIGLPLSPHDLLEIDSWKRQSVTEDDIRAALAWRSSNGHGPVRSAKQLSPGVRVEASRRVQGGAARPANRQKRNDAAAIVAEWKRKRGIE
jgi:DNA-binding Lrp family transcriptional regulator